MMRRDDWHVWSSLALGAAAGYLAVKMLSREDKVKINRWINSQMANVEAFVTDEELRARLKELYETTDARAREMFSNMYQGFLAKVYSLREAAGQIDRDKYREIADRFTQELRTEGEFTKEQAGKLKEYLIQDYRLLSHRV